MRRLPLRLAPIDGESLPGYVARYAHTFQFPPGDVIRALGLDRGSGSVAAAGRYGARLSAEQLEHAAFASGIASETLERMLLSRYAGLVFERSAIADAVPLASAGQAHEVLIWCSRFCPPCLREDGAWRVAWQLGWSAVCTRHQVLLLGRCPKCDGVPEVGPHGRWQKDRQGSLTDPTRCAHRVGHRLCRAPLTRTATVSVAANTAVLAAQRRLDAILDGQLRPTLVGLELEPPIYLRDLLTLCNLLDHHARRPQQAMTPLRGRGRRLHDHPAELATVLPEALALTDLPDPDALAEALRELADQRYRTDGRTLVVTKAGPASPTLRDALRRAVSQTVWASASRQLGLHPSAHRRPHDLDDRLGARHVPQLFWADAYHRELAELFDFDDFTHWLGRRFCSVLLERMLEPMDWKDAVRYLDFPERFINEGYNTTFAKLRTCGRFDELASRIKRIANEHAQQGLIDYKQRRARLADWDGIDAATWPLLQPRARPEPWRVERGPARRAHASVWL